jgi:hypothetical protein
LIAVLGPRYYQFVAALDPDATISALEYFDGLDALDLVVFGDERFLVVVKVIYTHSPPTSTRFHLQIIEAELNLASGGEGGQECRKNKAHGSRRSHRRTRKQELRS